MKSAPGKWGLLIVAAVFCLAAGCSCGHEEDDDDGLSPADDTASVDDAADDSDDDGHWDDASDDSVIDDSADDATDDTGSDDSTDDTADDDTDDEIDCLWNPDLPPEEGSEWRVFTVGGPRDEQFADPKIIFDGETPVIFWMDSSPDWRRLYSARLNNPNTGIWSITLLNEQGFSLGAYDLDLTPEGEIEIAIRGLDWGHQANVCSFFEDEILDCRGPPDIGLDPTMISLDHTPDGRPGLFFWDTLVCAQYAEETSPGVWTFATIPYGCGTGVSNLAIGPDGVAHFSKHFDFMLGSVNFDTELHFYGRAGDVWSIGLLHLNVPGADAGNMVISQDNSLYSAYEGEVIGLLEPVSAIRWRVEEIAPVRAYNAKREVVDLDSEERLQEAYAFGLGTGHDRFVCWARRENGLWRKEQVARMQPDNPLVYGLSTSSGGIVGVLFQKSVSDEKDAQWVLNVALRAPVEKSPTRHRTVPTPRH